MGFTPVDAYRRKYTDTMLCCFYATDTSQLKTLLEREVEDINAIAEGKTALTIAIMSGNVETVRLLVDHGADVNVDLGDKRTPLWMTSLFYSNHNENKAYLEMARILLDGGAEVNSGQNQGVLNQAVVDDNKEFVELLLEYDADINVLDSTGASILDYAIVGEHHDIVRVLVNAGAHLQRLKNLPLCDPLLQKYFL